MKWNNYNKFLYNDEPDGAGVGGGSEVSSVQQDNTPDIAGAVAAGMQRWQESQPKPQQQQRQYTQEEIDRELKVFKPTPELSKKFRDALAQDHGTGALQNVLGEMLQGIFGHTNTVTTLAMKKLMMDVDGEFGGVRDHISNERKAAAKKQFFDSYPDLKPFEDIMPAVASTVNLEGKSTKEANEILAAAAEKAIQKFHGEFKLTKSQAETTGGTNLKPAGMSTGGMGGGGKPPSAPARKASGIWS